MCLPDLVRHVLTYTRLKKVIGDFFFLFPPFDHDNCNEPSMFASVKCFFRVIFAKHKWSGLAASLDWFRGQSSQL